MTEQMRELMIEINYYRLMYQDMLEMGASEKGLAKMKEIIDELRSEARCLETEILATPK